MFAIITLIICVILSAYFSASEIAFASAKKHRLKTKADLGDKRATWAYQIYEHFDVALSSILIGNNLVNIAASSISTVLIIQLIGPKGTALSAVIMTVVILIFGEILPKILAKDNADKFVLFSAAPLRGLMIVLKPINKLVLFILRQFHKVWPVPENVVHLSQDRLSSIIETVEDEGIMDEEATDLMLSALDFPDITVGEIVTPRVDLDSIDFEDEMSEIIQDVLNSNFSRLPVHEGTIDNIKGILHVSNFLKVLSDKPNMTHKDLEEILLEDICVNETMKLPKVFSILNQGKVQMAIVKDEYGGTVGCVTVEDMLEELVGDIWDEYDEVEDEFKELSDSTFQVSAALSLRDFADYLDVNDEIFDSDYNSVGGLLLEEFGRFPDVGESIEYNERFIFTITEADPTKIKTVNVQVLSGPDDNEEE